MKWNVLNLMNLPCVISACLKVRNSRKWLYLKNTDQYGHGFIIAGCPQWAYWTDHKPAALVISNYKVLSYIIDQLQDERYKIENYRNKKEQ